MDCYAALAMTCGCETRSNQAGCAAAKSTSLDHLIALNFGASRHANGVGDFRLLLAWSHDAAAGRSTAMAQGTLARRLVPPDG